MELFSGLIPIFLFIIGFFVLIKGADLVIKGATSFARFLRVSEWLIGVVIVGIGTSIPELSINVTAALEGTSIGVGTILGSNIFNMLGIMGILAFTSPIVMRSEWVRRDFPINIGIIVLAGIVLFFPVFGGDYMGITRLEAVLLIVVFLVWMRFMARRKDDDVVQPHYEKSDEATWYISTLLIIVGLIGVFFGSNWVVSGAESIARLAGISEQLIALTVVALGTSVPEIAVSLRALMKGNTSIAVGNVLGSNIFDLIGIFGITGIIAAIPAPSEFVFDYLFLLITASVLVLFIFVGKRLSISRGQGLFLLLSYATYLLLIIMRG